MALIYFTLFMKEQHTVLLVHREFKEKQNVNSFEIPRSGSETAFYSSSPISFSEDNCVRKPTAECLFYNEKILNIIISPFILEYLATLQMLIN